jgi:polyhydroxyalkanoate synthesis regulator phasin
MARKPTPSILGEDTSSEPVEDILAMPEAETILETNEAPQAPVELPAETPKPKSPARKHVTAEVKIEATLPADIAEVKEAVVEATTEALESGAENLEQTAEAIAEELTGQPEEATKQEAIIHLPANLPAPVLKSLRVFMLASLGAASYAIEESIFIVQKLVERGELTQKEGIKAINELSQHAKIQIKLPSLRRHKKSDEPEIEGEPESESETVVAEELPLEGETPEAELVLQDEISEDEPEEDKKKNITNNIFTLNFLSFGSPVVIDPQKKKKNTPPSA